MEETPISAGRHTAAPGRRLVAIGLAVALVLVSIPLAAPGSELVPGAGTVGGNGPRWVLGAFGNGFDIDPRLFLGLLYAAIAIWVALVAFARDLGLRAVAVTAGVLITLFVLAAPLLSLDVFSYVAYARLGVEHGLNPYEYAPSDIPLDSAAARVVDYRDAVSVYGPLFTLGSYPLGVLGAGFADLVAEGPDRGRRRGASPGSSPASPRSAACRRRPRSRSSPSTRSCSSSSSAVPTTTR